MLPDQSSGIPNGSCVASSDCLEGATCECVALNRGLKVCKAEATISSVSTAMGRLERRGLSCGVRLPEGLFPMQEAPPPGLATVGAVVDLRQRNVDPLLRRWRDRYPWYVWYGSAHDPAKPGVGVPVIAGPDVPHLNVQRTLAIMNHLLLQTWPREVLERLANAGVRVLVAGSDGWQPHPEVLRVPSHGLGGGAPWFPSTGIEHDEIDMLPEELLHTVQYTAMPPRFVCMYHRAYARAFSKSLYTTDGSTTEVDGEPVPTLQPDEYFAMAANRWLGLDDAPNEYCVKAERREILRQDPHAFCLLAEYFNASDAWAPRGSSRLEIVEVPKQLCRRLLGELAEGCPSEILPWPYLDPSVSSGLVHTKDPPLIGEQAYLAAPGSSGVSSSAAIGVVLTCAVVALALALTPSSLARHCSCKRRAHTLWRSQQASVGYDAPCDQIGAVSASAE